MLSYIGGEGSLEVFLKLQMCETFDPETPLLGIYPTDTLINYNILFTTLFVVAKDWGENSENRLVKQILIYPFNGNLCSIKMDEKTFAIWYRIIRYNNKWKHGGEKWRRKYM